MLEDSLVKYCTICMQETHIFQRIYTRPEYVIKKVSVYVNGLLRILFL